MPTASLADAETARLRLRRWRHGDAAGLAAVHADREVTRFISGPSALTRLESDRVSEHVLDHWRIYGFGLWAAEAKEGGEMIGFIGLCHPLWFPAHADAVEVGWRLRRDAWGRGYATEGARQALRVGFEDRGLDEILAFIHPDNHRSAAVADRLGMTHEDRVPHPNRPHDVDIYTGRAP
jgi:RimJ/RimL family protein N-acetyltransferase